MMKKSAIRSVLIVSLLGTQPACQLRSAPSAATASAPEPPQIGSGVGHTCLLTIDGAVECWGQGFQAEPSQGSFGKPIAVQGLAGRATALGVGWYHTCAATSSGRVQCWGQNANGQLGNGTTASATTPVEVQGLDMVVSLSAGSSHTCALTAKGTVYCWGSNANGQLGDGTTMERPTPSPVVGLEGPVARISAGSVFSCAETTDQRVDCWGELGFAPAAEDGTLIHTTPVSIAGFERAVSSIAAGDYHLCALDTSGKVECRGSVFSPSDPSSSAPFDPTALTGPVKEVLAGADFVCALNDQGRVECQGDNYFAQLGDPAFLGAGPFVVPGLEEGVVRIGGGHYTACALLADGGVRCWGDTSFGQLGDGTAKWK